MTTKSFTLDCGQIARTVVSRGVTPFWTDRLQDMARHASLAGRACFPGCSTPLPAALRVDRVTSRDWPLKGSVMLERDDGARFRLHINARREFAVDRA